MQIIISVEHLVSEAGNETDFKRCMFFHLSHIRIPDPPYCVKNTKSLHNLPKYGYSFSLYRRAFHWVYLCSNPVVSGTREIYREA